MSACMTQFSVSPIKLAHLFSKTLATSRKVMLGVYQYLIISFADCAEQFIVLPICMPLMLPAVGKCWFFADC